MAYVPISQTKKTGGYVPIGSKKETPKTYSELFPATQKVFNATPRNKGYEELTGSPLPFAATKTGIAVNTVKGLRKAALNVVREIPRGIAGTAAQAVAPKLGVRQEDISLQPKGAMKLILGNKPIQPAKEGADLLKIFGVSEETAKKYGPILYAGLTLSDFVTVPGKKKGVIEALKLANDSKQARVVLKNAGITDDAIKSFKLDEKAVLAKTDADVENLFKNIPKEVVAKTTPLPKLAPVKAADEVVSPQSTNRVVNTAVTKPTREVSLPEIKKATDPVAEVALAKNLDDVDLQDTLNTLTQWLSSGARRSVDQKALDTLDELNFKPNKPVTLYRVGDVDDSQFQSWSTIKPADKTKVTEKVFTPNELLIDTTSPVLRELYRDDKAAQEVFDTFKRVESEIIAKPASMVKTATPEGLPPLTKLPPEMIARLESKQADDTINQAILDRYSQSARRPVKEDNALAAAAKKPNNVEGIKKITGELLTPISSRLMRINPILKRELRKFEFRVASKTTADSNEILPLLQATKRMSAPDRNLLDLAQKNSDSDVIDALATKYGIHDEINRTRDVLDDLHKRGREVGMDISYRKDYFPRMVTNPEKYMAYLRGTEDWGLIQRMLDNAATAKGLRVTDLTPEEQAALVNNLIRGYGDKITLAKPGFTKQRTINVIDEKLNEFYESSDSALTTYVVRMNDEIEGRKFFGKGSKDPDMGNSKIEDSIGAYVLKLAADGDIKPDQIVEVNDILKSRFHRGKMNGAIDVYRNAEYISTMGSPISAITQIGDIAFSLYNNGFYNTAKGIGKSLGPVKKKLSKEDLGIENVTQEFTANTMSGKALNTIFKLTGLEKMDRIGKETLVNGYLSKLKTQANKGDAVLKKELDFMFDQEESALAMKELANGELTERTKLLAFNKLLDFQPVAKSEMPQKYLEMPNGRLFYMLKSFTLKQYDIFRREAIDDIVSGDRKKVATGMKNLMLLSGAFVAANATADEIKDAVLGRETSMSDKLVDNMWRLVGATKYDVYKARQDGVGQTVIKKILFPTSLTDRFYKDVTNTLEQKTYEKGPLKGEKYKIESSQSIPVGGKLYYWWFGRGEQKEDYKAGDTNPGAAELPPLPELPKLPKI